MFKAKAKIAMPNQNGGETIIAQGVRVEGDFHSQGDVIIDGEVAGTVETQSALTVGETAKIHADVKAKSAIVAGEVIGNIFVAEMLELLATSHIKGDIVTSRISVAAGARINGKVSMEEEGKGSKVAKVDEEET
ncbi:MAG: polymer-forming cytoskeletal protein [Candidatus Uhrbacteria bacterium]|nr:polymer-forming cytoskeletal protein [Candidatus Uhrbacteria bacterium]